MMLFIGCASINKSSFVPDYEINSKLIPLKVIHVDNDPLLKDYHYLIDDFAEKYISKGDETKGEIQFNIQNVQHLARDPNLAVWAIPSFLTLCTINIFGFPLLSQTSNVTLQVNITDNNAEFVEGYLINGKGRDYVAMYWGYGAESSIQASKYQAFKNAMEQLAGFINEDAEKVNSKLNK